MKLGGEIKPRRLSVLDEYKFVNARARLPAREARALLSMGKESWRRPIGS